MISNNNKNLAMLTTCNQSHETECILRTNGRIKESVSVYAEGKELVPVPILDIGCEVGLHGGKWETVFNIKYLGENMSYVYFIRCEDNNNCPIKIGVAKNVKRRLDTLQVGNPFELILIASFSADSEPHARWLEKNLHKYFKSDCIRGEWFKNINMKKAEKICASKPFASQGKNARRKELMADYPQPV